MSGLEFDYYSRQNITKERIENLQGRIGEVPDRGSALAKEVMKAAPPYNSQATPVMDEIIQDYYNCGAKPSGLFGRQCAAGLLDTYVPKKLQPSYLYIIDKLNQFPFSKGWYRKAVRTASYGPYMRSAFLLLSTYEQLFYYGDALEDIILRKLDPEVLDYLKSAQTGNFSYLYAAEIDRGNKAVIDALKELICSENNTAYLDGDMILGILRSDNQELHNLVKSLLLAARLQEGLRQVICGAMDEGTIEAFTLLLKTVEEHNLIRFSSVKRAVADITGIFDIDNVDRLSNKMLDLMGQCVRDTSFCEEQLKTNDSVAISIALWAKGFYEIQDALKSMGYLLEEGTKNQRLTASYYLNSMYGQEYKKNIAKQIMVSHMDEPELIACFIPVFTEDLHSNMNKLFSKDENYQYYGFGIQQIKDPVLTDYFKDREEALDLYGIFMEIYKQIPEKGVLYNPCIFPWHQVELKPTTVLSELVFISFVLQDEDKMTHMAELIGTIQETHYALSRSRMLNLLLYEPKNKRQRELLIGYVGDAKENTSFVAYQLVSKLTLNNGEYMVLEDMLRFKRSALRKRLIKLMLKQEGSQMEGCLERLIGDKREEKRTAGLDILLQLSRDQSRMALYEKVKTLGKSIKNPSGKEKILIDEIYGGQKEPDAFYDTNVKVAIPVMGADREMLKNCIPWTEQEVIAIIKKLDDIIDRNKDLEYIARDGEVTLLGNDYTAMEDGNYPLAEELLEFYNKEIKSTDVLIELLERIDLNVYAYKVAEKLYGGVFGSLPFEVLPYSITYSWQVETILSNYYKDFLDAHAFFLKSVNVIKALTEQLTSKKIVCDCNSLHGYQQNESVNVNILPFFRRYFWGLEYVETEEEFKAAFWAAYQIELNLRNHEEEGQFLYDGHQTLTILDPSWFVKAYFMDMIPKDLVYKAIFEYFICSDSLDGLTHLMGGELLQESNFRHSSYLLGGTFCKDLEEKGSKYMLDHTKEGKLYKEIYNTIVSAMVDRELRRGDSETEFSKHMKGIYYISGVSFFIRILIALGNETLSRDMFYWYGYSSPNTKREVLSRLLRFCFPAEGEGASDLKKQLKGSGIKESRLVEAAMYAPQWIDIIEAYLEWKGFKSGCYYFMAHMDIIGFNEKRMAIVAKYTPLSAEGLRAGAFDLNWFNEVYGQLGEGHFSQLYDAAKYISNGSSHSRARKYADAATGKVKLSDAKKEIAAKRNKDLLMSYGLIPFGADREEDMVGRYKFLQQFLKESKKFGALRRSSEAKAVEVGLLNLSVNAGFSDITRLTLTMEGRMTEQYKKYMEWKKVEDIEVMLQVSESGKSQIISRKGDKIIKAVPSKLSKMEYVMEIKEVNKALRDQYSRTKKMMEEAMENQTFFSAVEIAKMYDNPVAKSIVGSLVYICEDGMGFLQRELSLCLSTFEEEKIGLLPETKVRVAHPLDFFRGETWHEYQKYLFEKKSKQPFKQIYRELYLKIKEEWKQNHSRMFSGNQIQPKKAMACLKARNWIADYQEGLQKIYYKDNIIATIYANTDWFSPNDVETPVLDQVEFFDRRTFSKLSIEAVPDIIYSEVMRDVDLMVSVAHAGGVDPETSHSTIEMRRAIVEFNLPLFGLTNVRLKERHALIKGSRGEYNVHLGSGIVHQMGGSMINMLPVHSQSRGKLFLPFIDEDPKTAEIMSKIVLLAEDKKIKDPKILGQIK